MTATETLDKAISRISVFMADRAQYAVASRITRHVTREAIAELLEGELASVRKYLVNASCSIGAEIGPDIE